MYININLISYNDILIKLLTVYAQYMAVKIFNDPSYLLTVSIVFIIFKRFNNLNFDY